jgi:putative flippase GtrA
MIHPAFGRSIGAGVPPLATQLARFTAVGLVSTAAYIALYSLLRLAISPVLANGIALLVTAVGNTTANRRLTFAVRDRATVLRHQAVGLAAFGIALGLTTGAMVVQGWLLPDAGRPVELSVLVAANLAATAVRFVLLRTWIGADRAGVGSRA